MLSNYRIILLLILSLNLHTACQADSEITNPKQNTMFDTEIIEELLLFPNRMILGIRAENVYVISKGSRSERVVIETSVLYAADAFEQTSLTITRYAQNDMLMIPGQTYLIAVYDQGQWSPAWQLLDYIELPQEKLAEAVAQSNKLLTPP